MVHAEREVLDLLPRLRPAVPGSGLLRIDESDARYGLFVAQVAFGLPMPDVEILHHGEPAAVVHAGADFVEPGPEPVGHTVEHPDARLVAVLHGIRPALGCYHAHVKDSADRLAAECGTVFLAV